MSEVPVPGRVFISYAHDDDKHVRRVRDFYHFLRGCGIDADLDLVAGERAQDWSTWMLRGIRDSRHVLAVASPAYKRRSEGDAGPGEGRGVQWESRLLRGLVYEDPDGMLDRIVPVVLPGGSPADVPMWLGGPRSYFTVEDFTVAGAESLVRFLTGQPKETEPPLGPVPSLPSLPPPVVAPTPVPPPQPPPPTFSFPEQQALIEALMGCPVLHQRDSRHELLFEMGQWLGLGRPFAVPESPDARTHLRALVRRVARTTLTADVALAALYQALEEIAPDDIGTEQVRTLLVASGVALKED
ncbi:effector-associated domain 2-containing protein [Streptomyces coeruleorubidus]|uniref:effector-associated domain 2-containing protein n=1 Tax=Streptomyces coeruleorubidus TaxID=116188 RepID=UPI0036568DD6